MQTLNSYARLIWVRHLHGISGNCQSPKMRVETRLSGHFCKTKACNTRMHVKPFIGLIVRKIALIRSSLCLTGYAGREIEEKCERFWRMPGVRSANTEFPACLANSSPMMNVGLFIARTIVGARLARESGVSGWTPSRASRIAAPFAPTGDRESG